MCYCRVIMKKKNTILPLKNRLAMFALCMMFLAHLFVFHTHLLDFSQNSRAIAPTYTSSCCSNEQEESQNTPSPCNNCCDCDLDLKTSDGSQNLSSFIPIEPFTPPSVPFFFFEESPTYSICTHSLNPYLVPDPLLGLRRALGCTVIRC